MLLPFFSQEYKCLYFCTFAKERVELSVIFNYETRFKESVSCFCCRRLLSEGGSYEREENQHRRSGSD